MAIIPEDWRKSGNACQRATAGDKDRRIAELEDRVRILENELRQKQEEADPGKAANNGEARYHAIVDSQTEMITRCTPDFKLTFVNEAVLRYSGLKREQFIGRSFFEFLTPDQHEKVRECIAALNSTNLTIAVENYVIMPDGEVRWQQWVNTAITDDSGHITEIQSVGRDTTERKLAELTLLGNQRFLNNVFESIKDGISILDPDRNIIKVNRTMEMWHPDALPLVGKKCYSAYHGRSEPCPWCPGIEAMNEKRPCSREAPHDIAGRTVGWREVHAFPMTDDRGNVTGIIDYVRDITERKQAEEALRESKEQLQVVFDTSRDMIYRIDPVAGRNLYFSPAVKTILGYTPEEMQAMPYEEFFGMVHPEDREGIRSVIASANVSGHGQMEYRIRARSGEYRWLQVSLTIIRDSKGQPLYRDGIARDITERRQAEESVTADLRDTQLLRDLGAKLVSEGDANVLYREITETAAAIMRSDFASLQMFHPDRDEGELRLLAFRGFDERAARFWGRVRIASDSTCGMALRTGRRVIVPDVEKCDSMARSEDLAMYQRTGIRAIQTTPLYSRNGRLVGMISTHWGHPYQPSGRELRFIDLLARQAADIIERRQAEEALRESEERYRAFFESSIDAILITTPDGGIDAANAAACRMFGYTEEELIRLGRNAVIDPADPRIERAVAERKRTGRFRGELNFRKKDGTVFPVDDSNVVFTDRNGKEKTVMILRDITERKRTEETIIQARDYYLKLFEDFPTQIWRSDIAGKCNYLNRSWYEFTGRTPEQEMGDGWMEGIHPDDRERMTAEFAAAFRNRRPFSVEFRLRHSDGSYRSIVDFGKPMFGLKGEFNGFIGSCHDITERKRAEEALIEAKQQAELYLDLMGHDINNMHQIALGYLEMAQSMIREDELQREFLDKPVEVLQRSSRLISNVRKMQKLVDGSLNSQTMDLCAVLCQVQRDFGSVPHKPVTLSVNGYGDCKVMANELLYDVFSNLVTNAIKHTGLRADVSVSLDVMRENDRSYYRVSVADNGPGIPDSFKSVIFNRVLKGTSEAKGMGIGLYLVKSLADSYHGRVWVEDRVPGDHTKGSRFVVLLPALDE